MKLIYCPNCEDIIKLKLEIITMCQCSESSGRYLDGINAEISGLAIPLEISNDEFINALSMINKNNKQTYKDYIPFNAFIVPNDCKTIKVSKEKLLSLKRADFKYQTTFRKAIILEIKNFRKKGAQYGEIAELFNIRGYDTLTGVGKWHTQSVHRLDHYINKKVKKI